MPNDRRLKVDPFALAIVVLLYAEHLLFGADRVDISLPFAVVHLLILAGLVAVTRGRQPQALPYGRPAILLGVVFVIGLISILPLGPPLAHPLWSYAPGAPASISLDPVATRVELIKLAGFTALFLIGAGMGANRHSAERLANYLVYGGILYSLWAFIAWVTNPHAIFGVPRPYGGDRLGGSFLSANIAGTLFAGLATMSLVMLLRPFASSRKSRTGSRMNELLDLWPQALLLLLALPCLLLTASRGGLMAFVAAALLSIGCLAWIRSSQRSLSGGFIAVVSVLLCAAAVVFLVSGDRTAARIGQIDPMNNDRLQIFAAYWPTIKASPWLGYGLGAFHAFNYASVTLENGPLMTSLGAVHNVYLQWMLQMGLPGVLAMVGCIAVILIATVRGAARRSSQQTLAIACVGVSAVFAVHSLVDFPLEQPSMAAFFALILGLGYGIAERPAESSRRRA